MTIVTSLPQKKFKSLLQDIERLLKEFKDDIVSDLTARDELIRLIEHWYAEGIDAGQDAGYSEGYTYGYREGQIEGESL